MGESLGKPRFTKKHHFCIKTPILDESNWISELKPCKSNLLARPVFLNSLQYQNIERNRNKKIIKFKKSSDKRHKNAKEKVDKNLQVANDVEFIFTFDYRSLKLVKKCLFIRRSVCNARSIGYGKQIALRV